MHFGVLLTIYRMASRQRVTVADRVGVLQATQTRSHRVCAQSDIISSRRSGGALCSAVRKAFLMANFIAIAAASTNFVDRHEVVCVETKKAFTIAVNSSSHTFGVRSTTWLTCEYTVTAATASAQQQSRARLVKLEGLRASRDRSACQYSFVQVIVGERLTELCSNAPTIAQLLWIVMPFTIRHNSWTSIPSYWFSFYEDAEATNLCGLGQNRTILKLKNTMYAFATNSLFKNTPPNDVACTLPEYDVTVKAENPSTKWTLIVLAAPPTISCWSLLLNGRSYSSGEALSPEAGSSVTLRYVNCSDNQVKCQRNCKNVEGFTLRAEVAHVEIQGICSNADVMAIAAGSFAVGAMVAIAVALTGALLFRRYRRAIKRHSPKSSAPLEAVSRSADASVTYPNEEISMHDNEIYGVALAT